VQAEPVQRLEAVEADRDLVQVKDDAMAQVHAGRGDAAIGRVAAVVGGGHGFLHDQGLQVLQLVSMLWLHDASPRKRPTLRRRTRPTMPCGRKRVVSTKISPS